MKKHEIVKYCLTLPDTFQDYPFPNDNISVVLKHIKNKKWFALLIYNNC